MLPFLDSAEWTLWKPQLLAGCVDVDVADTSVCISVVCRAPRVVGPTLRARFDTGGLFEALRLDPYLRECGRKHADLAGRLNELADNTAGRPEALVHGDVSPKTSWSAAAARRR